MHLLSSGKISFSMVICCKCLEHSMVMRYFSSRPFLKQLASCFCRYPYLIKSLIKSIELFWYLDNFLEKDKTGLLFQISIA